MFRFRKLGTLVFETLVFLYVLLFFLIEILGIRFLYFASDLKNMMFSIN